MLAAANAHVCVRVHVCSRGLWCARPNLLQALSSSPPPLGSLDSLSGGRSVSPELLRQFSTPVLATVVNDADKAQVPPDLVTVALLEPRAALNFATDVMFATDRLHPQKYYSASLIAHTMIEARAVYLVPPSPFVESATPVAWCCVRLRVILCVTECVSVCV